MFIKKQNPGFFALAFGLLASVYRTISSGGLYDVVPSTSEKSMIPGFDGVDDNSSTIEKDDSILDGGGNAATNFTSNSTANHSSPQPNLTKQEERKSNKLVQSNASKATNLTEEHVYVDMENLTVPRASEASSRFNSPNVSVSPPVQSETTSYDIRIETPSFSENNRSGGAVVSRVVGDHLDPPKNDSRMEPNLSTTTPDEVDAADLMAPSNASVAEDSENVTRWGENMTSEVIFYNIFIHPSKSYGVEEDPLRIVEEQMQAINSSGAPARTLFYNLIGRETNHSLICPPDMDCRRLAHHPEGNEVATIQDLYEFCLDNPNHTVTYIHDKGSFNVNPRTASVRHFGTKGAVSSACLTMPLTSRYACNACAFNLHLQPNVHTSANMWTARCSLVSQLFPPKDYEAKRRNMFLELLHNKSVIENQFPCLDKLLEESSVGTSSNTTDEALNKLGLGRYAMELWLWSHPDTIPCVVAKRSLGQLANSGGPWNPKLQVPNRRNLVQNERILWYRKEGRLWEMDYLYGRHADESHPFWAKMNTTSLLPPAEC